MRGITLTSSSGGQLVGTKAMETELHEMGEVIEQEREHFAGTNFFTAYAKCFALDKLQFLRTLDLR